MKKCNIEKSKKKHSEKTCSYFFCDHRKKSFVFAHDTIQLMSFFLHYLNMKIKGSWVEIIDLKIHSSLKLDGV